MKLCDDEVLTKNKDDYLRFINEICSKHFIDKSVLIVGIGGDFVGYTKLPDLFISHGAKSCECLEVWKKYIEDQKVVRGVPYKITEGNVRSIKQIFAENQFDNIVWSHGPEHVSYDDLLKIIPDIEYVAKNLILFVVPSGNFWDKQSNKLGNPHEVHVQKSLNEENFKLDGFKSRMIGNGNEINAQLCLWKEL